MEDNYNIVMVFATHQHELALGVYVCPPSWIPIPPPSTPDPSRLFQSPGFGCQESPSVGRSPIAVWGIRGLGEVISPSSLRVWISLGRGHGEAGNTGPHPNTLMSGFQILAFLAGFADRLMALRGQLLLVLITPPGKPRKTEMAEGTNDFKQHTSRWRREARWNWEEGSVTERRVFFFLIFTFLTEGHINFSLWEGRLS